MKISWKVRLCYKTKIDEKYCLDGRGIILNEFFCIFQHQATKSVFLTYMSTYNDGNERLHFVKDDHSSDLIMPLGES